MCIKKIIVSLVLIFSLLGFPTKDEAKELEIVKPADMTVEGQINYYSSLYGVDNDIINKVIQCESRFNPNAHNSKGENSWGLVQINLDSHPEITKEQALDTNFSINYLAKNISLGKGRMWTSYRAITNGGVYSFFSSKLQKQITVVCR